MPARPAGAQGRLEWGGGAQIRTLAYTLGGQRRDRCSWFAGSALGSYWSGSGTGGGALRLQPPAPRAGWEGGGSGCASIGGAGEWGGGQEAGGRAELWGGCINREWGDVHPSLGEGGCSAQRKWKVCGARRPRLGSPVRTCGAGTTETPHAELTAFFSFCKLGGGVVGIAPSFSSPQG